MNTVMIVPTGLGAEIGGHAGDATPAAKLLAACSENLVLHPNVVNGSDINEMPENCWYVEGSLLDRFLAGDVDLERPRYNRILLVVNKPVDNNTINSVSAARATIGADITILELETSLKMGGSYNADGSAAGWYTGLTELLDQVRKYDNDIGFDALAIQSTIEVDRETALRYFEEGGVNPWGGIEAIVSRKISDILKDKAVAHAPLESGVLLQFKEIVDPRLSAEVVSVSYLHCVLKGLHRAPRPATHTRGLATEDIGVLVSAFGCWGPPHIIADRARIPTIMVRENQTVLNIPPGPDAIIVENYWEAAGYIMGLEAGIDPRTTRRPIPYTNVLTQTVKKAKEEANGGRGSGSNDPGGPQGSDPTKPRKDRHEGNN